MTSRIRLSVMVLTIAAILILAGLFLSSGPRSAGQGPYESALASIGVATAEAAGCQGRACTFASPGFICTESSGARCSRTKTGCETILCGH